MFIGGTPGRDFLRGTNLRDTLFGFDDDDLLMGLADDDSLNGGPGNDILDGGTGADRMIGGKDNDTYFVDNYGDVVTEFFGEGTDLIVAEISYDLTDAPNVENLTLWGSAWMGTGNALDNDIIGNSEDNVLLGGDGNDRLEGGIGSDRLNGEVGADRMIGGQNDDTYYVDNINDVATEFFDEGTDEVYAEISYELKDNVENLSLTGSASINGTGNALNNDIIGNEGHNVLKGGDGHDNLYGGHGGTDTLIGGTGNDTFWINDFVDVVTERFDEGTDWVISKISYTLGDNIENLSLGDFWWQGLAFNGTGNKLDNIITGNTLTNILYGLDGADRIEGSWNDDYLYGGAGNDVLDGGWDNDLLWGGTGIDVMTGGSGIDRFCFVDVKESGARGSSPDQILDFSTAQGDKIDLSAIDANITTPGGQAFAFIGNNVNFFAAGQLRCNGGFVEGDINGDLSADFRIQVNTLQLAASDFIL